MKRRIYIFFSIILGVLLFLILHAGIEIWYVGLLVSNFDRYSLGLSWDMWYTIHHVWAGFMSIIGAVFGYMFGVRWWRIVYIEKRHWYLKRFRHDR